VVDKARDEPRSWSQPELEELIERVVSNALYRVGASSIRDGVRDVVRKTVPDELRNMKA